VKLPGTDSRKNYRLVPPGGTHALAEGKGESLAISIAWQMWNKALRSEPSTQPNQQASFTLQDVCQKFFAWAETYYRRADGTQTSEAYNCKNALTSLLTCCEKKYIDDIAYHDILDVRQSLIDARLARNTINQRVGIWKRFFAWALENRYCSAHTKSEVWAIVNLKKNRSQAKETKDVTPTPHWPVKRTLPYMTKKFQDIIRIIEFSGARRSEITKLRHDDIVDIGENCLVCHPEHHKTAHKGKLRQIVFGPRATALLRPYLDLPSSEYVFPPDEQKLHGGNYSKDRINVVVKRAIERGRKSGLGIPHWTPNQLRHACGTRVRKKFGGEAARIILGHANGDTGAARITDRYTKEAIADEELKTALKVMKVIG